jgi:hypothetical protein
VTRGFILKRISAGGVKYATTKRERAMSKWTVWVGGSEMSSNLLTKGQAVSIANDWFNRGYNDVVVEEIK